MTHVHIKTGTEGPRHDPYSFEEITVKRPDGRKVILHVGLGTWADVRYPNGHQETADQEGDALAIFERVAGASYRVISRAMHSLPLRRLRAHPCGLKDVRDVSGYPGETFLVCGKCGDVLDSVFCRSAIE